MSALRFSMVLSLILVLLAVLFIPKISISQVQPAVEFTYRGDINEDGQVNIFDLLEMLKLITSEPETDRQRQIANVDKSADGDVNIFDLLSMLRSPLVKPKGPLADEHVVLLDTSVIIDGRIADISQTGFIEGTLLVPRFILEELQYIADSSDALRRKRGRRGLDILNRLQQESIVPVDVTDMDVEDIKDADGKLIRLAKNLNCPIITNDYNLNRVAQLQGVRVLNINELANAVKTAVLHGESLRIRIIQEGTEPNQGVGYLDDGTMVVVEDGLRYINHSLDVVVTKVLQTAQGRMIFAQPHGRYSRT